MFSRLRRRQLAGYGSQESARAERLELVLPLWVRRRWPTRWALGTKFLSCPVGRFKPETD